MGYCEDLARTQPFTADVDGCSSLSLLKQSIAQALNRATLSAPGREFGTLPGLFVAHGTKTWSSWTPLRMASPA